MNKQPALPQAPILRRLSAAILDALFFISFALVIVFFMYYIIDEFFIDIQAISERISQVGIDLGVYINSTDELGNSFIAAVSVPSSSDSAAYSAYMSNYNLFIETTQDDFTTFNTLVVVIFAVSTFVAGTIIYVLLPYLYGNGQTLGKKFLKLAVVTIRGEKLTKMQVFMRFALGIWFAEIFFSFLLFNITQPFPLFVLISVIMMAFSASHRALHDVISSTIVIAAEGGVEFVKTDAEEIEELRKRDIIEMQQLEKKIKD